MAGVQAGRDNKLYYNDTAATASGGAGNYTTPVWVLIDRVGDVNRAGTKSTTEVDMRASETTIVVYGNKSREITFTYYKRVGTTDSVFDVLEDSFENNTVLDIAMMEGAIATSGTQGVRGPFIVSQMDKSEPIAGVDAFECSMQFADAEQDDSPGTPFLYDPDFNTP